MWPPTILPQKDIEILEKFPKEFQYCTIDHTG